MKTENDKLNECADWHDDAAIRLAMAAGTADQSSESANKSWAEQHRIWAKSIRMAALPNPES